MLLHIGRDQWFFLDEWWLLSDGTASRGLLDAYNGHWITIPAIAYRINYWLWGLRTYLPYQVPVVLLHVGSAVLLRILMRRLGVRGWIATVAALVFVFFGSGSLNIFFGFQISLTGSLFCGLALLLLSDRDGSVSRHDWLALGVGMVGLMTSGVFVAMVAGVGVATLLRRGVRVAAFYTLPLAFLYSVWYVLFALGERPPDSFSSPGEIVRFCADMLSGTFTALAQGDLGGLALALCAFAALVVTVVRAVGPRRWAPLALPAGLLAAWIVFAVTAALARAGQILGGAGAADRYLHITAALFLPLVALGAELLARRNVLAGALPLLVLAAGLPGNLDELTNRRFLGQRDQILTLAHSEYIDKVPPDLEPVTIGPFRVPITAGWLARGVETGRIPEPEHVDPITRLTNYGRLALRHENPPAELQCPPASDKLVEVPLAVGQRLGFEGNIEITVRDELVVSKPIPFLGGFGSSSVVAELGPLHLEVRATDGKHPRLCHP